MSPLVVHLRNLLMPAATPPPPLLPSVGPLRRPCEESERVTLLYPGENSPLQLTLNNLAAPWVTTIRSHPACLSSSDVILSSTSLELGKTST
jgi:hypothetical protein